MSADEYPTIIGHGPLDTISRSDIVTITVPNDPNSMSQAQLNEYGIEKISYDEYQANSKAFGKLSADEQKTLKDKKCLYRVPKR